GAARAAWRRGAGAQGCRNPRKLSPRRDDGRCGRRGDAGDERHGPVSGDSYSPAAAGAARPAGAGMAPSQAAAGRGREEARQAPEFSFAGRAPPCRGRRGRAGRGAAAAALPCWHFAGLDTTSAAMIYVLIPVLLVLVGLTVFSLFRGLNAFRQEIDAKADPEGARELQLRQ